MAGNHEAEGNGIQFSLGPQSPKVTTLLSQVLQNKQYRNTPTRINVLVLRRALDSDRPGPLCHEQTLIRSPHTY